ncbi:MAG: hypothetical protein HZB38_10265 [Planctomycetes bacterium]|nr:hypothetical protein [Planctomycetota bacterium]
MSFSTRIEGQGAGNSITWSTVAGSVIDVSFNSTSASALASPCTRQESQSVWFGIGGCTPWPAPCPQARSADAKPTLMNAIAMVILLSTSRSSVVGRPTSIAAFRAAP